MRLINQMAMAGMGGKSLGMESRAQGPSLRAPQGSIPPQPARIRPCLLREDIPTQRWGSAPLLHPMGCPSGAPITYLLPSHPAPERLGMEGVLLPLWWGCSPWVW